MVKIQERSFLTRAFFTQSQSKNVFFYEHDPVIAYFVTLFHIFLSASYCKLQLYRRWIKAILKNYKCNNGGWWNGVQVCCELPGTLVRSNEGLAYPEIVSSPPNNVSKLKNIIFFEEALDECLGSICGAQSRFFEQLALSMTKFCFLKPWIMPYFWNSKFVFLLSAFLRNCLRCQDSVYGDSRSGLAQPVKGGHCLGLLRVVYIEIHLFLSITKKL